MDAVALSAEVGALARAAAMAALAAVGCAHYEAHPVTAQANLERLERRSLLDPGLARAVVSPELPRPWPPETWDLTALTWVALHYHPDIELARASWAEARGAIATARERSNPVLTAGPGYNASTPASSVTPWILNLAFDWMAETAGKRSRRVERATQLCEAARFNLATTAWQVRSRVRQALLDLFASAQRATLLERQLSIQERNVEMLQRQLSAGVISSFEMTQARLIVSNVRLQLADVRRQQAEARTRVAASVAVPVAALDGIQFNFDSFRAPPPEIPDAAAQRAAMTNRGDVQSAFARYEASETDVRLEVSRQYPDLHLGPGYQDDQGTDKRTMLLTTAMPFLSHNRGPLAEAQGRRASEAAAVNAVQARVMAETEAGLAGYRAATEKLETAELALADARQLEDGAQKQLSAGDISQLDLGVIQLELITRELARFDALIGVHEATGFVEDAIQRPADLPWNAAAIEPLDELSLADRRNQQ
jgi:outer membrane protein TolC